MQQVQNDLMPSYRSEDTEGNQLKRGARYVLGVSLTGMILFQLETGETVGRARKGKKKLACELK